MSGFRTFGPVLYLPRGKLDGATTSLTAWANASRDRRNFQRLSEDRSRSDRLDDHPARSKLATRSTPNC